MHFCTFDIIERLSGLPCHCTLCHSGWCIIIYERMHRGTNFCTFDQQLSIVNAELVISWTIHGQHAIIVEENVQALCGYAFGPR